MATPRWMIPAFASCVLLHELVLVFSGIDWQSALQDAFLFQLMLLLAGLMMLQLLRYYSPGLRNGAFLMVYTLIVAVLISLAHERIAPRIFLRVNENDLAWLTGNLSLRAVFAWLIIVIMVLSGWFGSLLTEQKQQAEKQKETERMAVDAELFHLRQQLQPHFLFNSLNSIYALIGQKPAEARAMTMQLADFLRGTVDRVSGSQSTLEEELQLLRSYLSIEQVRFGDRLNVVFEQEEGLSGWPMPSLLLQPLLENAIKHGLGNESKPMTLTIRIQRLASGLNIVLSNPAHEKTSNPGQRKGFGLHSVARRLQLQYRRSDLVQIKQENGLFIVSITLPAA